MDWISGAERVHNAVVLVDGCDHYTAAQATTKGWSAAAGAMDAGRFGGQSIKPTGTYTKALPSTYSTLIVGFAIKAPAAGSEFFQLRASTTGAMRLSLTAGSIIQVLNSGGTVIATGSTALTSGAWYYIEVKAVIAGASGSTEVHLEGVSEIASTTGNFGSTNIDNFRLVAAVDYDDFYAVDTTGGAPWNTFLGVGRISTVMANADGAHTDYTPSSGTNHYDRVNETTPDGDTTYVSDATVGHIDSYAFDDIDGGATVFAVQTCMYARKDDAGTRQLADLIRRSGTDYVGNTATLSSTYTYLTQIHPTDPSTSAQWTAAGVNAAEFGVKTIA